MGNAPRAQDRCRPFSLGVEDSQGGSGHKVRTLNVDHRTTPIENAQ
ncbi:hypothetical protein ACWD4L_48350 [Streptomyces sp. NPDC002596]|nr:MULTISPECIES: hypothetical protein [unclassified Streptomyces]MCX4538654.1 hypothetical protein [Streptomyces sp. NBC_01669]WSA05530.1 hypothetical protein OHA79_49515 [Streptomyces sp. NBC_00841]